MKFIKQEVQLFLW